MEHRLPYEANVWSYETSCAPTEPYVDHVDPYSWPYEALCLALGNFVWT